MIQQLNQFEDGIVQEEAEVDQLAATAQELFAHEIHAEDTEPDNANMSPNDVISISSGSPEDTEVDD